MVSTTDVSSMEPLRKYRAKRANGPVSSFMGGIYVASYKGRKGIIVRS